MKRKDERIGKRKDGVRRGRNGKEEKEGEKMEEERKGYRQDGEKEWIGGRRKEL